MDIANDIIDDRLEELAVLAEAWQKRRTKKLPTPCLRGALIRTAQELVKEVEYRDAQGIQCTK